MLAFGARYASLLPHDLGMTYVEVLKPPDAEDQVAHCDSNVNVVCRTYPPGSALTTVTWQRVSTARASPNMAMR